MHKQRFISSIGRHFVAIGMEMSLWARSAFVFVKIWDFELGRNNYPRHEAHCSSIESGSLDTLHGSKSLFVSMIHFRIFGNPDSKVHLGFIEINNIMMIVNIIPRTTGRSLNICIVISPISRSGRCNSSKLGKKFGVVLLDP